MPKPPKPGQRSCSVPGRPATIRSTRMRNVEKTVLRMDTDMEVGRALGIGATARVPNRPCLAGAARGVMMLHAKLCVKDGATGVVMTKGNVIVGMSLSFLFDSGAVDLKVLVPADHHSFEYSGFFVCSWTCKFLRGLDL